MVARLYEVGKDMARSSHLKPFKIQLQLYLVTWTSSAPSEAFVYSNFFARVSATAAGMDSETLAEASARHQTDGSTSPS